MNIGKRGQEEIVGFLLIVIIVIVLGVVFIFMMKPQNIEGKDFQLDNLLYSIVGTTVDGMTVGDRIQNCEQGIDCETLHSDLNNITATVFRKMGYSLGRNVKGYILTITQGMEYSYSEGTVGARSIASVTVVRNSLVKLKFYY